jgi:hypothetical protein
MYDGMIFGFDKVKVKVTTNWLNYILFIYIEI